MEVPSKFLNVYDFGMKMYCTALSQSKLFLKEKLSCDRLRAVHFKWKNNERLSTMKTNSKASERLR